MIRTGTQEVQSGTTIRTIMFDRPERRNALTPTGLDQLEAAVTEATEPVILLRGAGEAFSAGADLDVVGTLTDREGAEAFARHGQRVANAIADAESIVVAGIDGPARGGGLELALACDVRVATPTATFAEPGVEFGLFGAWGGTVRLREVCGLGEAMDLACSGRVVDAETALRMGLVSRIVEADAEANGTDGIGAVAAEIASADPAALAVVKERFRDDADRATQEEREAAAIGRLVANRSAGGDH